MHKWDSLSKPERAKLLSGAGLPTGLAQLNWSGLQKSERKKLEKGKGWFEAKEPIMTAKGIEHKAPEHHRVAIKKEAGKALNKRMERKEPSVSKKPKEEMGKEQKFPLYDNRNQLIGYKYYEVVKNIPSDLSYQGIKEFHDDSASVYHSHSMGQFYYKPRLSDDYLVFLRSEKTEWKLLDRNAKKPEGISAKDWAYYTNSRYDIFRKGFSVESQLNVLEKFGYIATNVLNIPSVLTTEEKAAILNEFYKGTDWLKEEIDTEQKIRETEQREQRATKQSIPLSEKEAWERTLSEYGTVQYIGTPRDKPYQLRIMGQYIGTLTPVTKKHSPTRYKEASRAESDLKSRHARMVEEATTSGKPVPLEVLASNPWLNAEHEKAVSTKLEKGIEQGKDLSYKDVYHHGYELREKYGKAKGWKVFEDGNVVEKKINGRTVRGLTEIDSTSGELIVDSEIGKTTPEGWVESKLKPSEEEALKPVIHGTSKDGECAKSLYLFLTRGGMEVRCDERTEKSVRALIKKQLKIKTSPSPATSPIFTGGIRAKLTKFSPMEMKYDSEREHKSRITQLEDYLKWFDMSESIQKDIEKELEERKNILNQRVVVE